MSEYEIQLAGPIGPVAASCLPGFTTVAVPPATVLTGTVTCPDDLLGVLNLLSSHGLAPIDIRIDRHHPAEQPTSPADRG
ncbi:MAG TPA: hypothetical protein VIJ00_17755 [Nakamurella sp.]